MKQTILSIIVATLFLTFALETFGQQKVTIHEQPDSPLQLSNVVARWRKTKDIKEEEWNILTVNFISQNVSDKTIRAYTIRQFSGESGDNGGLSSFSYSLTTSGLLKPNQLLNQDIGEQGFLNPPENIKIGVDFVEFTDGSTWGKDNSNSAQQLAGIKAGVKATLEYLREINKQNGIEAVIEELSEMKELLPPEDKSVIWKRGYQNGVRYIKLKIKRAFEKDRIKAVEAELQNPFDIS